MSKIKKSRFKKGFTLIEVLLVIVLISILLIIVLFNINTEARFIEARNDIRKTNIQVLEGAITQYRLQTGSYPTGLNRTYQEICDPDASSCTGYFDLKTFLVPKYLQAIPQDPNDTDNTGGSGYEIAVDATSNTVGVRLKSTLREGGVDIKVNDPLPNAETTTTNTPLAATVPQSPPSTSIVTNGLVLNLDAGNTASYPGSGTTWFDLSGNGNNSILVNGVGYDVGNGGSLLFDGLNDYSTLSSSQLAPGNGAFTWNFWIKLNNLSNFSTIFSGTGSNTDYGVIFTDPRSGAGGLGYYALGTRISDNNTSFGNNWLYITFVGNGGANGSRNLKLYRNSIQAGSTYTYDYNFTSTTPNIGANHSSYSELMRGNISNVSYYNRNLTDSEIQQNFNATKGRFGL